MTTASLQPNAAPRQPAPWDPVAPHRFHASDGTTLFVTESGPADADLTLVLVHAWVQDHTEWEPILPGLPDDVRVIRYDHRGHGGSAPASAGTATVERLADDLAELIADRVPRGKVVLVGHSMGGMTVMALGERHPELVGKRVAAVALLATSCDNIDRLTLGFNGTAGRVADRVDRVFGTGMARLGARSLPVRPGMAAPFVKFLAFGRKVEGADVKAMTGQLLRAHPGSVAGFRDSMRVHDRRLALALLRQIPVTVMVGDRDRITPEYRARSIADELPDAEYVLLPGAGHELTYERTAEVRRRLHGLLAAARGH